MENKNIFEIASRQKFRFVFRGVISVEDLWDLSVSDLDSIYRTLNADLKKTNEESLLKTKTAKDKELEAKMEIVKYIFEVKSAEAEEKVNAKKKKEQQQRIRQLIADKQDEELKNKSLEELLKIAENLDD